MRHHATTLTPIGKRGKAALYDLQEMDSLLKKSIAQTPRTAAAKTLEERKLDLQCQKLQVEIDERKGRLIAVDDVRRFVSTHSHAVTMHVRKLGGELAPQLQGLTVAKAEKKINAAGEELIANLRSMDWGGPSNG